MALAVCGCDKFGSMDDNPYAYEMSQVKSESFVQPILYKTEYNLCSVYRNITAHLMQHAISASDEISSKVVANYNIPEGTSDDVWSGLYIQYGNALKMYETAARENNVPMQAVALVLRAMLISTITDTYGDVPFTDAGLLLMENADNTKYTTAYDPQKEIYRSIVVMLEDANELFSSTEKENFEAIYDLTFNGDLDKWRRYGNALYAKVLNRIAMKVIEEDGGVLTLDEKWGAVNVTRKLSELYECFVSGAGEYPTMRSISDCARVPFDADNEYAHTPFYTLTSGLWNGVAACDVLMRRMLDYNELVDSRGQVYYTWKEPAKGGHVPDPRWDCYFRKVCGAPTQMLKADQKAFLDGPEHKSAAGNSLIGRLPNGLTTSAISGKMYNLQNAAFYSLMNYSELYFIFAEAGARGYITDASGFGAYLSLFRGGITQSILEWRSDLKATDTELVDFVNYICNGELFSGATFNSDNAIEAILVQKWVSTFFVGVESWCDYRRTGFPLLKTNGPAAGNKFILPTRLRYPSDEAFRNVVTYQETLDRWLGGTNNIQTDVWWANTAESQANRLKGRQ